MLTYGLPIVFALFVWWFSTGLIMYLDGLPRRTFKWSILAASILLVASLWELRVSSDDPTVRGAYVAFAAGLLAWGWQEISFYMGFVTGPRTAPCPEGCRGWRHFGHAIQTSLWHELAIIASAIVTVGLCWRSPNQVGVWTFMVLWWMHQSAKLNVFLGVRNLNEEFLPEHLQFLRSFLTKKSMNLLFPFSVTISTVITVHLVDRAIASGITPFQQTGFTFLATMMVLAILEHWLLMLPLPAAALWGWSLRSRKAAKPFDVEIVAGFLGAGKTTFLRNALATAKPELRTVVLVNDFSSVGVDGSLLRERGADVVELPNGCICCSLRSDLATQLTDIVAKWAPERILIEPSGVADVAALMGVLAQPALGKLIRNQRVSAVIDAGAFLADYARMRTYFEAQARVADVLVLNKVDLVSIAEREMVQTSLRALNPLARIVPAQFGIVLPGAVSAAAARGRPLAPDHERDHEHEHAHARDDDEDHDHDHAHHGHAHRGHRHEEGLGLSAWTAPLARDCDLQLVQEVLNAVCEGGFGRVERLKGIARAGAGWMRFDVAGGRARLAAFAAADEEQPRVVAIGRALEEDRLRAAFEACARATPIAA